MSILLGVIPEKNHFRCSSQICEDILIALPIFRMPRSSASNGSSITTRDLKFAIQIVSDLVAETNCTETDLKIVPDLSHFIQSDPIWGKTPTPLSDVVFSRPSQLADVP